VVSDAIQRRFFNLVHGVMLSHDNPNPVTYPLKRVALYWWEPFSNHNAKAAEKLWMELAKERAHLDAE
jgi:hypothetical protein